MGLVILILETQHDAYPADAKRYIYIYIYIHIHIYIYIYEWTESMFMCVLFCCSQGFDLIVPSMMAALKLRAEN